MNSWEKKKTRYGAIAIEQLVALHFTRVNDDLIISTKAIATSWDYYQIDLFFKFFRASTFFFKYCINTDSMTQKNMGGGPFTNFFQWGFL